MSQGRDFYKILGVKRSASEEEIKKAYKRLAKEFHPDRNPDNPQAEEKFKEVQQAYNVLKDPGKRSEYDRFGEAGVGSFHTGPGGKRVYEWGGGSTVNVEDLEDLMSAFGGGGQRPSIFEELFGRARGSTRRSPQGRTPQGRTPQNGRDARKEVKLTFEQAVHGTSLSINLRDSATGRTETLDVKIPAGVDDGQKIRLRGKGHPGSHGGTHGDLILECRVATHEYFQRNGVDIVVEVPVSVTEAALGAKIEVPTMNGFVTMTLPPGTTGGTRMRLAKRGIQSTGRTGDQIVVIRIDPPTTLTDEQRETLEKLRSLETDNPRDKACWNQGRANRNPQTRTD